MFQNRQVIRQNRLLWAVVVTVGSPPESQLLVFLKPLEEDE